MTQEQIAFEKEFKRPESVDFKGGEYIVNEKLHVRANSWFDAQVFIAQWKAWQAARYAGGESEPVNDWLIHQIDRDICELEEYDPDKDDAICISHGALLAVLRNILSIAETDKPLYTQPVGYAGGGEAVNGDQPSSCRMRLQREGKAYPKSGCLVCKTGGLTGCPYGRNPAPAVPDAAANFIAKKKAQLEQYVSEYCHPEPDTNAGAWDSEYHQQHAEDLEQFIADLEAVIAASKEGNP